MRVLATIFISGVLAMSGAGQTTKPKPVAAKGKPAATKPVDKKKTTPAKGKTADNKSKPAVNKPKVEQGKKNTIAKPKPTTSKNNPVAPNPKSTSHKNKPVVVKPKPKAVKPVTVDPVQVEADEQAEFEKASATEGGAERIAALKKFIRANPAAKRVPDAAALIVTIQTQLGNDQLTTGDLLGAIKHYKAAISDAPKPVPDQLFADTIAKFPANLYFRGARTEAFEIAKAIEIKSDASVSQLLAVATFYMSVENGSEARRLAESAIKLDPISGAAYQTLGLANRMDFLLDESEAAYAKALEIEPESAGARRGLAEMKRALGKSNEAVTLYREIIAKDEADLPARTGLVLALFDAGKRSDAETELGKALDANPGNVILQAGAAYWYATNNEGDKAVDLAQKALANDPRFIWSHIALARGYIAQRNPVAAEKTLLAARRYGNFPTLEYEIAAARASAGFYREAADELAKSFIVKDGLIYTKLGGRIDRGSKDLAGLVGFERKASIFAPASSDSGEFAASMKSLLELKQELDKTDPDPVAVARAADDFVRGDDKMKVHRIVFAGTQLLDKKIALAKVIDLTKTAPQNLDAGLEVADPAAAIMASELYESRTIAATRGDYVNIPVVTKSTLSSVLRGRVEEINGWARYQLDDPAQATVHLKRAVSVLPADSAWWRSSTWRLATSLSVEGKNAEALEMYIRSYKSSPPDPLRYSVIESLYRRVNGHTMGLENQIGANPAPNASPLAAAPRPTPTPAIPVAIAKVNPTPEVLPTVQPTGVTAVEKVPETIVEAAKTTVEPSPTPVPIQAPKLVVEEPTPTATPEPPPTPDPTSVETPKPLSEEVKVVTKPGIETTSAITAPSPTPEEPKPSPTPETTREPSQSSFAKETAATKLADNTNGLFPPVIINIPPPATKSSGKSEPTPKPSESSSEKATVSTQATDTEKSGTKAPSEAKPIIVDGRPRVIDGVPTNSEVVTPCTIALDQETITVQSSGNERAVVVRRTDDGDIDSLTASSTSPNDISIRREPLPGVKWTALFVLRSVSAKPGVFQIKFEAPCGKKEVVVRVR